MSQSPDLRPLLAPRSIAIVGASDESGPSSRIAASLEAFGFTGGIYPVNPRRTFALGRPCAPSLTALATPPDAAVLCIGPERVAAAVLDAAAAGVKAVVSYASGVQWTQHDGQPSLRVIQDACARAGMAFCGPDCMGVLNPASSSSLYLSELLDPQHPARVELPDGMVSGLYKYIVFEPIEHSTGKVYEEPCHRIMGTQDDLSNSDWVAAHHWCVPLYYRPGPTEDVAAGNGA